MSKSVINVFKNIFWGGAGPLTAVEFEAFLLPPPNLLGLSRPRDWNDRLKLLWPTKMSKFKVAMVPIYNDHPGELKNWLLNTGSLHIIQPQFIPANIKTVQLMLSGNSIRFQQSC